MTEVLRDYFSEPTEPNSHQSSGAKGSGKLSNP